MKINRLAKRDLKRIIETAEWVNTDEGYYEACYNSVDPEYDWERKGAISFFLYPTEGRIIASYSGFLEFEGPKYTYDLGRPIDVSTLNTAYA